MKVKTLTIVGGGTAGWLAAAYLSHRQPHINITVVDKEVPDPIGVGEATILTFLPFLEEAGLPIADWFMEFDSAYKSGILFTNWQTPGEDIWHPFYKGNDEIDPKWKLYDLYTHTQDLEFKKYLLAFYDSSILHNSVDMTDIERYALHVDCGKVVKYLRKHLENKITLINSEVTDISYTDRGGINFLTLNNGDVINSDLFVDCTGFKQVLRKECKRVDLSDRLFVNTAVAGHVTYNDQHNELTPYVKCDAVDHGWIWKIPVQNRIGSGMLFNRNITDVDTAKDYFVKYWDNRISKDNLKIINWDPYYNEDQWHENIVSIGLSAGFIEPLESTGVGLMTYAIGQLNGILNENHYTANEVDYFNIQMKIVFENCINFVAMHYANNSRTTPFWNFVNDTFVPSEEMQSYLEDFKDPNITLPYTGKYNTMFGGPNWSIFLIQLGYELSKKNLDISSDEAREIILTSYVQYEKYRHLDGHHHSTEIDRLREMKKYGIS